MDMKAILDAVAAGLPRQGPEDYDCNNGALLRVLTDAAPVDFDAALQNAAREGFAVFADNTLENNRFVTLRRGNVQLHIYFCPAEQRLRMVADPFSALYDPAPVPFERTSETTLWQFESDHTFIDCGMCFILRCADNSFFLIDSGHYLQLNDHQRIYRFLRNHTPAGQKIVIGGWFITHGHDDHVCKFIDFLAAQYDDVVIERLYYNAVSPDCRDSHYWKESNKQIMRDFERAAQASGLPIVKLHAGQKFFIRNLECTVLCTHEDVYPASLENYNDSSTVLMIEADGCRIAIPGDAGAEESDILTARYTAQTLHCDIMQQSHHGHFGTSVEYYRMSGAKVVLFPVTQIMFDGDLPRYEANRVAIELADEYHIASNGTTEVPIPYVPGTVRVLPDETFENFDRIHALWGYTYTDEYKQQLFDAFLARSGLPPMDQIDP